MKQSSVPTNLGMAFPTVPSSSPYDLRSGDISLPDFKIAVSREQKVVERWVRDWSHLESIDTYGVTFLKNLDTLSKVKS